MSKCDTCIGKSFCQRQDTRRLHCNDYLYDITLSMPEYIGEVRKEGDKAPMIYPDDFMDNAEHIETESEGKKYDTGKSMVGTLCRIFPNALLEIGKCIEYGTHKYPAVDNWVKVDDALNRYQDAMMRHYLKFNTGKKLDEETNLPHLAHLAWNVLAILELYLTQEGDNV